jgi:hypothetical protein
MINNTSMTSTIGVTLISEVTAPIGFFLIAFAIASLSPGYIYRRALRRFKK